MHICNFSGPDCTFDSVNRCEWVAPLNIWGNYWKLLKGETDSGGTGPENDANDNREQNLT